MGWKDILKVLPPSDWIVYPYPEMEEVSSDYRAKAKDIGSTRFIVRPHYLDRLYNVTPEGHGTRKRNTDDLDKWVNCAKNLPVGNLKQKLDAKISEANTTLGIDKGTIDSITGKLTKNKSLDLSTAKKLAAKIKF